MKLFSYLEVWGKRNEKVFFTTESLELNENIELTNNNLVVLSKDDFEGFNLRNLTSFLILIYLIF